MAVEGRGEENGVAVNKREGLKYERKRKRGLKGVDKGEMKTVRKTRGSPSSAEEPARRWPVRERKAVKRLSVLNSENASASKAIIIKKGNGMKLKDIPNVAYNLSKKKVDNNLQMLHTILFRKKSNKYHVKRNLRQFSGFVWDNNEERERKRLTEKVDKCIKESLFYFCELLGIPISKASKKEELKAKLLGFLESPHATTEISLAEKEQEGKRHRRMATDSKITSPREASVESSDKKRMRNDESKNEDEEQDDLLPEEGGNPVSQRQMTKEKQNTQRKRAPKTEVQGSSCRKKKTAHVKKDYTSGPGTQKARANSDPGKEELLPVIANILTQVDFEAATFEDIHRLLEDHFNLDMSHRKAEVRSLIEESLINMTINEVEEEDAENSEDADE